MSKLIDFVYSQRHLVEKRKKWLQGVPRVWIRYARTSDASSGASTWILEEHLSKSTPLVHRQIYCLAEHVVISNVGDGMYRLGHERETEHPSESLQRNTCVVLPTLQVLLLNNNVRR